ncbi:LAME_0G08416g1_1 [Lachancea meyersii CBS 8951]|uniref:LAME_0G08416g1_1 n=1 Tax=Lachancea meyersii CBS 8951 TaxID=1266667 RepID=A0A1G4K8D0_9SACH|nr:LAME_0G08416g1_1 [Lachancea meyersii CBS 8951]
MKRELEIEPVVLEDYLSAEQLHQLSKLISGPAVDPDLVHNWHFQYVVGWLEIVCDTSYTADQGKAFFSGIAFDEKLLLQDLHAYYDDSLYTQIRSRILKTVTQNKTIQLKEWDVAVKYNLAQRDAVPWYSQDSDVRFADLSLQQQFEILYACIKFIERRNQGFRMYLGSHLPLFQFPECVLEDRISLLVLPGGKIIEKKMVATESAELRVPIKFKNCSVRYEDESSVEVVQLDFGPDIEDFLAHISLQFTVVAGTWEEYLEYLNQTTDAGLQDFLAQQLPVIVEVELNGRRLLANRERDRSMAELLVRRKRSSRLVAREEDTRRRDLEARWLEKLDERDQYLRTRQRAVAKVSKAIKDSMWPQLWEKFEQDVRVEKLRRRTTDTAEYDVQMAAVDAQVLENGERFQKRLIEIDAPVAGTLEATSLELPDKLVISQEELQELANHGVSVADYSPDSQDWVFQCPCNVVSGVNLNDNDAVKQHTLVCCDMCLRWQHLECQHDEWIALLGEARQRPLNKRDFATATLGGMERSQRRSARRAETESPASAQRPSTASNAPSSLPETFVCGWCMQSLEDELRGVFKRELSETRAEQRRIHEERERRKRAKEERKIQAAAATSAKSLSSQPKPSKTQAKPSNAPPTRSPAKPRKDVQAPVVLCTVVLPSQL